LTYWLTKRCCADVFFKLPNAAHNWRQQSVKREKPTLNNDTGSILRQLCQHD
jgi:hypothetical protein